jgi:hypothetical protein
VREDDDLLENVLFLAKPVFEDGSRFAGFPRRRLIYVCVRLYHRAGGKRGDDDEQPAYGHGLSVPGVPHGDA